MLIYKYSETIQFVKLSYFLRNLKASLVNNSIILRIKNAKFSGCCIYMNTNIKGNFQVCISVPSRFAPVPSTLCDSDTEQVYHLLSYCNQLQPGGLILLTTINRTLLSALFAKYAAEYLLRIVPQGTHEIEKFITPEEITRILRKCKDFFFFLVVG